jgi:hypothetical protein
MSVHNDSVGFVKPTKEIPHVFCLLHGQVGEAIQDELVIRFGGKFSLEQRRDDRPSFLRVHLEQWSSFLSDPKILGA